MAIEIDFEGVSAGSGFDPLEDGDYPGVITKFAYEEYQGKGGLNMEITLDDMNGRRHWNIYDLQAKSLWKLKGDMVSLGYAEQMEGKLDMEPIMEELQNQKVMVTLRKVPKWNDPSREINECVKIVKRDGTDW